MDDWKPIESAPRDGTHILACNADPLYREYWTFAQRPPTVVHWFDPLEYEGGFFLSVQQIDGGGPFKCTHWMPLPEPPQ